MPVRAELAVSTTLNPGATVARKLGPAKAACLLLGAVLAGFLGHVAIFVTDLDASEAFYSRVFGLKTMWKSAGDKAYLTAGKGDILGLLQADQDTVKRFAPGLGLQEVVARGGKHTESFFHFGYNYTDPKEFKALGNMLRSCSIPHTAPHTSRDATIAIYVQDPDGYFIQLTLVPAAYMAVEQSRERAMSCAE